MSEACRPEITMLGLTVNTEQFFEAPPLYKIHAQFS